MVFKILTRRLALEKIYKGSVTDELYTEIHIRDLIMAEYLRKSLCNLAYSLGNQSVSKPIYITRLISSVRRQLYPLWSELNSIQDRSFSTMELQSNDNVFSDFIRRVLYNLETIGDAMNIGNGYWLPTPIRFIQLPSTDKVLVIGGSATQDLSQMFGTSFTVSGFARYLDRASLPECILSDISLWQSYQDWVGDIPQELDKWTESILNQAKSSLRPSASNFENFEVYVPSSRITKQFFRWVPLSNLEQVIGKPTDDLLLCRSIDKQVNSTGRNYWLGIVSFDGLKKEAPVFVPNLRRLMYGLDLLNNASTHAVWEQDGIINLSNWIPREELRLVVALGVDVSARPDRLPLRFMFKSEWKDNVICVLNKLGVYVDEEEKSNER